MMNGTSPQPEKKSGSMFSAEHYKWTQADEPHFERRKKILEKYPQVKELFGTDWNTSWKVCIVVSLNFLAAYLVKDAPWWVVLVTAYVWGGTINHSLFLVVHEISHNLIFEQPFWNTVWLMIANMPVPVPFSISFQKYHRMHHIYLGGEGMDPDLPTIWEGGLFQSKIGKLLFLALQPLTYTIRPITTQPLPPTVYELSQWVVQMTVNAFVVYYWGWQALAYFMLSAFLGGSLHPMAGHFIAEHYAWEKDPATGGYYETYSYYGIGNLLGWNVGAHREHHDLSRIPYTRLDALRKMAPEFYDDRASHSSWIYLMYRFVMDPEMSPFSRTLRKAKKLE